jgi:hypothetical protein
MMLSLLERMWKEAVVHFIYYPALCLEGLGKTTKPTIMIAAFWAYIWTQNLQNIKQECNHSAVFLAYLPKVGLCSLAVCMCIPSNLKASVSMKRGMYIMAPEPISLVYFIKSSHLSVSACVSCIVGPLGPYRAAVALHAGEGMGDWEMKFPFSSVARGHLIRPSARSSSKRLQRQQSGCQQEGEL